MENAANASKIFWDLLRSSYFAKSEVLRRLVNNSFLVFLCVRFWSFLSWYHLQCVCNKLETEAGTLHGICYILQLQALVLHGFWTIWLQCQSDKLCRLSHFSQAISGLWNQSPSHMLQPWLIWKLDSLSAWDMDHEQATDFHLHDLHLFLCLGTVSH